MTSIPPRDIVVPNSVRLVTPEPYRVVTVRCGRCSHKQEARADARTTRCRGCGRTCKVQAAPAPDVIPFRRSA